MKSGLLAANENCALYLKRADDKQFKFDAYLFIKELLEIHTAYSLVKFLDSPNTACFASDVASLEWLLEGRLKSSEDWEPLIKRGSVFKSVNDKNIDYLDCFSDLDSLHGPIEAESIHSLEYRRYLAELRHKLAALQESISESKTDAKKREGIPRLIKELPSIPKKPTSNCSYIDYSNLSKCKAGLSFLFTVAAIAFGDTPPQGFIEYGDPSALTGMPYEERTCLYIDASPFLYAFFTTKEGFEKEGEGIFIDLDMEFDLSFDIESNLNPRLPCFISREGTNLIMTHDSRFIESPERIFCGAIAASFISYLAGKIHSPPQFSFSEDKGVFQEGTEKDVFDMIFAEAVDLVSNRRVMLCEVCGNPFVMAYEAGRDTSRKRMCGDSCRQKKSDTMKTDAKTSNQ